MATFSGKLVAVSAPSGAGKSTLINRLLAEGDQQFHFSVSYTTRPAREGEIHGRHYYFIDDSQFAGMIDRDVFMEHALVHGKQYGTAWHHIRDKIREGRCVILDIDIQGFDQVKRFAARHEIFFTSIFIDPFDVDTIVRRLEKRPGGINNLDQRIATATIELSRRKDFDFPVVNEDGEEDRAFATFRRVLYENVIGGGIV